MKILRVISGLDPRAGGPIEGARRIDAELIRMGHHVEVVCMESSEGASHYPYPAEVHALGPALLGYGYAPRLIPWLREKSGNFDAVIVNGLWQYHSFAVWRALLGSQTPYFVFTHGMLDPWFKRTYPLKHLKKWLYWPWAEYRVLRDARAVLFTSEEERVLARDSFKLYRCNEEVTAYGTSAPPMDASRLSANFLQKYPQLRQRRLLLFLSRIHEKKGCDLLIRAFAKLAACDESLHLVMAGPDKEGLAGKLQQLCSDLCVSDRVTWTGMLQGEDKWGAFYSAEVFCLPSHQENFGIVVAEAMACGKPVLISNKVNIWREIQADSAGIVQNDTLEGTTQALKQWLALAPEAKREMGEAASRSFNERFRIDRVAESLIRILKRRVGSQLTGHAPRVGGVL